MADYRKIYDTKADAYEQLVSAEDVDGEVTRFLGDVLGVGTQRVAEVGAGTGRLTRLLLDLGHQVHASETAAAMRDVARRVLSGYPGDRWTMGAGTAPDIDFARDPYDGKPYDAAIAGWVFGHLRQWNPDNWRDVIGSAYDHMQAALRPGGKLIIFETMGTGATEPRPPSDAAKEFYDWMEMARGFKRHTIRTDYGFASTEEAIAILGFFFGERLLNKIREHQWSRVPECTGVWVLST